jgi:hypothetical protein
MDLSGLNYTAVHGNSGAGTSPDIAPIDVDTHVLDAGRWIWIKATTESNSSGLHQI